jgi:hypothetical protein
MNATKSIVTLYKLIGKMANPIEAKNAVTDALFIILSNLEEEGLSISEELIDERFSNYVDDFTQVSKSEVA